ncbi:MAG: glucan biosynthesis protein, partial [Planctomycetota bacterium]|nr:glucan biosynthesis protein [Planctomycetota bacterium]
MTHRISLTGFAKAAFAVGICSTVVSGAICEAQSPTPTAQVDDEKRIDVGSEDGASRDISRYEDLVEHTRNVASQPGAPREELPLSLARLNYDAYRMIAFRYERALWWNQNRPFWLEFFHRGFVHRDRVSINILPRKGENGSAVSGADSAEPVTIPFDRGMFEYRGPTANMVLPTDIGYAGYKVIGRFPGDPSGQEMLTFLGASYFRSRSGATGYGTSARGLAVNPAATEEFPVFREFWIRDPDANDRTFTTLALMDSPSVAGAYEFTLTPGAVDTTVSVKCTLFFRDAAAKAGIAPLTSMWMWG